MIKKIIATICAVGLIFASCFVPHKINSKAETYYLPNVTTANIQQINGIKFVPFFQIDIKGGRLSYESFSILIQYTLSDTEDATAFVGGGFAVLGHTSSADSDYGVALYRDGQKFPYYQQGFDMTALFDWSTVGEDEPSFPSYGQVTFSTTTSINNSGVVVELGVSPLTIRFVFLNGTSYNISTSALYTFVSDRDKQSNRSITFSSVAPAGAIYTEDQYIIYGNQQYQQGQQVGYDKGYSAGLADGDGNSFLSLITAVIDAPITAFTSLFNFEILGFNMRTFVLSILTAALVVAIMRFFMGKIR